MYETVQVEYFAQAEKIAEQLKPLNKAVFTSPVYNYQGRRKEALAMQGVIEHASVRQPLPSLTSEEVEAVRQGLSGVGLIVQERV